MGGYFELVFVLSFAAGWLILELVGKRLDRKRDQERKRADVERSKSVDPS